MLTMTDERCGHVALTAVLPGVLGHPRTRPDTFSFTINGKTFKAKVPFNRGLAEQRNLPWPSHGKAPVSCQDLMGWFGGLTLPNHPTFGCSVFPCQVREQPDGSLYVSLGGALQCLVESYSAWNWLEKSRFATKWLYGRQH